MRIGVDVGGTNTDAVAMVSDSIVAVVKTPTTKDVGEGVSNAISELLKSPHVDMNDLDAVVIGTTHFTNAFVERRDLAKVGILRLSLPANSSVPPLAGWPEDLRSEMSDHIYMLDGGNNFDGRPVSALDEGKISDVAKELKRAGIRSVSVTSLFSPATPDMELRAKEILCDEIDNAVVTLSHQVGGLGFLDRENSAIINATLAEVADRVTTGLTAAMARLGISAPLFLSQNDGTLMSLAMAREYPVRTFAAGATNSMRGAHFLSGESSAMVADIGGTTTDVGALVNGYPRNTTAVTTIGGVRTNIRMPDAISVGLGGGSVVTFERGDGCEPELTIGPNSVGYKLREEAVVFGGDTLTSTDIAVAAGHASVGERSRVEDLDDTLVEMGVATIQKTVAGVVDRMKIGAGDIPLVLVGGGSILVSDTIEGTSKTVVPEHADVANAVGAAISQVGMTVEKLVCYDTGNREQIIEREKANVKQSIVESGGDEASVSIVEMGEVQLAYMPGKHFRLHIRAVADLRTDGMSHLTAGGGIGNA